MTPYPITYSLSFVLIWGLSFGVAVFYGKLMFVAYVALMMLVLICHEHAHAEECVRLGIEIKSIEFTAFGGMVKTGAVEYVDDAISIFKAGVANTGYYAVSFFFVFAMLQMYGRGMIPGFNLANNAYIDFAFSSVIFTSVLFLCNILPVSYHSKEHGLVATDGYAIIIFRELHAEMMNEGKYQALNYQ